MTLHLENQMREKTLSYSLTDIFTFQKFISISVFKQNVGGQPIRYWRKRLQSILTPRCFFSEACALQEAL